MNLRVICQANARRLSLKTATDAKLPVDPCERADKYLRAGKRPSGEKTRPKYASRLTMPWTMPVTGAGGVTTVEEGPVGVSDAVPHALTSDITAQSATVVRAGLVMTGMRFRTTEASMIRER